MSKKIELYHYTRADRLSIEQKGMLIRTKEQSRQDFMDQFKSELSSQAVKHFTHSWEHECDDFNPDARHSVWFVSKRPEENCSGIFYLVSMYGGEVISMIGEGNEDAKKFLESIGEPLEIVCSIPVDDPNLVDFGNTELRLQRAVLPSEIVEINKLSCDPEKYEWKYIKEQ
ncbi:hypothetical protein [Vibrio anguillarum]|uniref:hypothetical protein n=1 Tax=Vibrio anguillarum TaxID=55601 RepID=UPI000980288E|nr:hypothetical protein [Vibrio anguillarum]AQP35543.1 hypothetical protein AA909_04030 [Vibrio anguillarum]EJP3284413.1 hypothetical protein [Vibrio parahaemolyticus]